MEVKRLVRERDGWRCKKCKMTDYEHRRRFQTRLHVHRLRPGSRYTVDGCVTLCEKCHNLEHYPANGGASDRSFGAVLKHLIEERSLSMYAVAQRAGLSDQTVHNLIVGARKPLWDTVRRLAKTLGVTPDHFDREEAAVELPEPMPGRPRGRPKKPPNKSTDQHG